MADIRGKSKEVDDFLLKLEPPHHEVARALREIIFEAEPDISEGMKWGRPVYVKGGSICSIDTAKDHVSLVFFEGACLKDPANLLMGAGENYRYVKVGKTKDIQREELKALIADAVRFYGKYVIRAAQKGISVQPHSYS